MSAQVASSLLTERLPAICGKATLTMVVSSTSMKAPSVTMTAMIQMLPFGRQLSSSAAKSVLAHLGRII